MLDIVEHVSIRDRMCQGFSAGVQGAGQGSKHCLISLLITE